MELIGFEPITHKLACSSLKIAVSALLNEFHSFNLYKYYTKNFFNFQMLSSGELTGSHTVDSGTISLQLHSIFSPVAAYHILPLPRT